MRLVLLKYLSLFVDGVEKDDLESDILPLVCYVPLYIYFLSRIAYYSALRGSCCSSKTIKHFYFKNINLCVIVCELL